MLQCTHDLQEIKASYWNMTESRSSCLSRCQQRMHFQDAVFLQESLFLEMAMLVRKNWKAGDLHIPGELGNAGTSANLTSGRSYPTIRSACYQTAACCSKN